MDTNKLKKFAQDARRVLIGRVKSKLDLVLAEDSAARRERASAVRDLESKIRQVGEEQVIEQVAYTWFNRFTALQYMDMNGFNRVRIIAPIEGQTRPEILSEATAGIFNDDLVTENTKGIVSALLDGRSASNDPENEAYRHLVVSACNYWHKSMPYMFEKILDFTELLMPEDLLSATSILTSLREVMTEEVCKDVEVIGWLYQFYISEKKDDVFAGLKKNQKITPENIPAATQLLTQHWIVRYLVENSLGRLWMLNRPHSKLAEQIEYYIKPEEPETDFIKISKPQELKICDPACGSGHMLTYAFDLLHAIYEEEGFDPKDIPEFILQHNLTGIEIDERAGSLASFALAMKAAEKLGRRRFLRIEGKPDICVLENVSFEPSELQDIESMVGRSLFTADLRATLTQLENAKNFGSLIIPKLKDPQECLRVVEAQDLGSDMFRAKLRERLLTVLRMSEALSSKYHVVVANPPYMGNGGMNNVLKSWSKDKYLRSKSDTYAMFIERGLRFALRAGYSACITIQNWMYQSSFENLRLAVLEDSRICGLLQIGYNSFPELNSKVALGSAFILRKGQDGQRGEFFNLNDAPQSAHKGEVFLIKRGQNDLYSVSSEHFKSLPGSPIAYQASEASLNAFENYVRLNEVAKLATGIIAGDNDEFVRGWHEVSLAHTSKPNCCMQETTPKWFPLLKGGDKRKWFGNLLEVIDFKNNGARLRSTEKAMLRNEALYFKAGIHWNRLSGGAFYSRKTEVGSIFEDMSPSLFSNETDEKILAFLNSKLGQHFLLFLSAGWKIEIGQVGGLPINFPSFDTDVDRRAQEAIKIAKYDWNYYETSWDFTTLPLLSSDQRGANMAETYAKLRSHWQSITDEMQRLEEENNKIFIDSYGLQDELTPEVSIDEITLTCNPHYRYGGNMTDEEREARLLSDTMAEFLSYAVGCMFGRYSLDKPSLVLANQG